MIKLPKLSLSGFAPVLIATVISGLTGYVAVWVAAQHLIPTEYTDFSILWSTIFFIVGALSGLQQEITRSTTRGESDDSMVIAKPRFFLMAFSVSLGVFCLVVFLSLLGVFNIVSGGNIPTNYAISFGLAFFVFLSVLLGTMYGRQKWKIIAIIVAGEGITRLLLISVTLFIPSLSSFLPWAIVLPFGLTVFLTVPLWKASVKEKLNLDVSYIGLTKNSLVTIGASAATAVLISGFPLILRITTQETELVLLAPIVLVVMLVRAPLVVLAQSMQNFLIVKFSGPMKLAIKLFLSLTAALVVFALIAAVVAMIIGPQIIQMVFGTEYEPSGIVLSTVLFSSGILAIQIVSGSLVLARGHHGNYILGWMVSAITTIASLMIPLGVESRVMLALVVGPIAGIISNATSLVVQREKPISH